MAVLSTSRSWRATLAVSALLVSFGPLHGAAQQQQQQGIPVPKWLSDNGKDLFTDLQTEENVFSDGACESREKLLKEMAGHGEPDASHHRARVLLDLGSCMFKQDNYAKSALRYASAISEMNVPNEDTLLARQETAHIPLMRQAADLMKKHQLTEAAVALRRCRVILERNVKTIIKHVHKQMKQGGQDPPPVEKIQEEIPGYGKTGQMLPNIVKQIPHAIKSELQQMELLDNSLDSLDKKMAVTVGSLKQSRTRLDKGKGAASSGVLLYVKALPTEPVAPADSLLTAQEIEKEVSKALIEESASVEKSLTLVKRAQLGKDCKEDKGLTKTCEALQKVPDVMSNGFGETRLVIAKAGKKQSLDVCTTNANVAIVVAAKDGVKLTVKGHDPQELEAGKPVVVDFCLEASLEAKEQTAVLFAQVWHPEFAAVERTTELRLRSEGFGLKEDVLKAATKIVNDNAKKTWDKTAKAWRKASAIVEQLRSGAEAEVEAAKQKEKEADEAKRAQDMDEDENRKKGLEELEIKRAAKKKKEEELEAKRKHQAEVREQERAMKDPWLNAPAVKAVEAKIEDFKEQRRDANAKLEFEDSTQLTKDISAAERELKRATKKARKEHKKAEKEGRKPDYSSAASDTKEKSADKEDKEEKSADKEDKVDKKAAEIEKIKKELEDVKEKKKAATEAENFKEAKKLKAKQQALQDKLGKLEL